MRVLQVHTRYREAGGEDVVVEAERALLEAAGHEVLLHGAANPGGAGAAVALAASSWNTAAARRAAAAVAAFRPDVAHVHNTWYAMSPAVPAAIAGRGVPVVATLHNYRRVCANASLYRDGRPCEDCVGRSPWPGVRHRCYRGSLVASAAAATTIAVDRRLGLLDRSVRRFLAVNEFARERFVRGGLAPERIALHPNSTADPGPRAAPPSAGRSVVVFGRVEAAKGVDVLVDAWAAAPPPGLELLVVGDGELRRTLEARAVPGVRLLGAVPRPQVLELLLTARALAFPSVLYEGQPMTVLEAMSAGLPVLASDRGGTPALLDGTPSAWRARAGDRADWTRALHDLAQAPAAAVDGAGGVLRGRWARDHSQPAALERLLGHYAAAGA